MIQGRVVSRKRHCRYCGDLHEVGNWPHNCMEPEPNRSDLPSPYVIRDSLPGGVNGLYHHAACKKIDSKAAYRQATREAGCIEVGNEHAASIRRYDVPLDPEVTAAGVNDALHELGLSSECDMKNFNYSEDVGDGN